MLSRSWLIVIRPQFWFYLRFSSFLLVQWIFHFENQCWVLCPHYLTGGNSISLLVYIKLIGWAALHRISTISFRQNKPILRLEICGPSSMLIIIEASAFNLFFILCSWKFCYLVAVLKDDAWMYMYHVNCSLFNPLPQKYRNYPYHSHWWSHEYQQ